MRIVVPIVAFAMVVTLLGATPPSSGSPGASVPPAQGGGPPPIIVNRVIDLLDDEILLEAETDHDRWESDSFDTSQFDVVALRGSADVEESCLVCRVAWQFGTDDAFEPSLPAVEIAAPWNPPPFSERPERIEGLSPRRPLFGSDPAHLSPVRGMRAKVVCEASILSACANIGDDPSLPMSPAGTLTDVKVLLRRY